MSRSCQAQRHAQPLLFFLPSSLLCSSLPSSELFSAFLFHLFLPALRIGEKFCLSFCRHAMPVLFLRGASLPQSRRDFSSTLQKVARQCREWYRKVEPGRQNSSLPPDSSSGRIKSAHHQEGGRQAVEVSLLPLACLSSSSFSPALFLCRQQAGTHCRYSLLSLS